jgi:hypothetical protein
MRDFYKTKSHNPKELLWFKCALSREWPGKTLLAVRVAVSPRRMNVEYSEGESGN